MSRSVGTSSLKRKRPSKDPSGHVDAERTILSVIKSKREMGIWERYIKAETNLNIPQPTFKKHLKSLVDKNLIKEIKNIHNKGVRTYMAVEFEPSKEVSGGVWYVDGNLDKELVNVMKKLCLRCIRVEKAVTLEKVYEHLKKQKVVNFEISSQHVSEILNSLVLDNEIIEVKSTGLGEYYSIPIGTVCYRFDTGPSLAKGLKVGAFASIPCGACPRISLCTPDGIISPSTCVYYSKWLNLDF